MTDEAHERMEKRIREKAKRTREYINRVDYLIEQIRRDTKKAILGNLHGAKQKEDEDE